MNTWLLKRKNSGPFLFLTPRLAKWHKARNAALDPVPLAGAVLILLCIGMHDRPLRGRHI
jgi:hypothetical protein